MNEDKRGRWTTVSARQNLPTLVDLALRDPQEICRRDKLVGPVVSPDAAEASRSAGPTAAQLLADLNHVCHEADYELPVVARTNRSNAFVNAPGAKRTSSNSSPARKSWK